MFSTDLKLMVNSVDIVVFLLMLTMPFGELPRQTSTHSSNSCEVNIHNPPCFKEALIALVSWLIERSYEDLSQGPSVKSAQHKINIFPLGPQTLVPPLPSRIDRGSCPVISDKDRMNREKSFVDICKNKNKCIIQALREGKGSIRVVSSRLPPKSTVEVLHEITVILLNKKAVTATDTNRRQKGNLSVGIPECDRLIVELEEQEKAPVIDIAIGENLFITENSVELSFSVERHVGDQPFEMRVKLEKIDNAWHIELKEMHLTYF